EIPGDAEVLDITVVDLRQGAVALLAIGAAVGHPVARLAVGVDDAGGVHIRRFHGGGGRIRLRRLPAVVIAAGGQGQTHGDGDGRAPWKRDGRSIHKPLPPSCYRSDPGAAPSDMASLALLASAVT